MSPTAYSPAPQRTPAPSLRSDRVGIDREATCTGFRALSLLRCASLYWGPRWLLFSIASALLDLLNTPFRPSTSMLLRLRAAFHLLALLFYAGTVHQSFADHKAIHWYTPVLFFTYWSLYINTAYFALALLRDVRSLRRSKFRSASRYPAALAACLWSAQEASAVGFTATAVGTYTAESCESPRCARARGGEQPRKLRRESADVRSAAFGEDEQMRGGHDRLDVFGSVAGMISVGVCLAFWIGCHLGGGIVGYDVSSVVNHMQHTVPLAVTVLELMMHSCQCSEAAQVDLPCACAWEHHMSCLDGAPLGNAYDDACLHNGRDHGRMQPWPELTENKSVWLQLLGRMQRLVLGLRHVLLFRLVLRNRHCRHWRPELRAFSLVCFLYAVTTVGVHRFTGVFPYPIVESVARALNDSFARSPYASSTSTGTTAATAATAVGVLVADPSSSSSGWPAYVGIFVVGQVNCLVVWAVFRYARGCLQLSSRRTRGVRAAPLVSSRNSVPPAPFPRAQGPACAGAADCGKVPRYRSRSSPSLRGLADPRERTRKLLCCDS